MKRTSHRCTIQILLLDFIWSFRSEALYLGVSINTVLERTLVIEVSHGIVYLLIKFGISVSQGRGGNFFDRGCYHMGLGL